jgi:hypothetical protein
MPTRIYRAISTATIDDGRLALVNAVVVTVPIDGVASPVPYVAPTGISHLIGMAGSYVKAQNCHRSRERQYDGEYPHTRQSKLSRSKRNATVPGPAARTGDVPEAGKKKLAR